MASPLIAVTAGPYGLNDAYRGALEAAGAELRVLAPGLAEHIGDAVGVMLTGGADIDPARYGEARHESVTTVSPERDRMEFEVLRQADEEGLPVLAICRGMQVLNVARGGSLHQHIPAAFPAGMSHAVPDPRCGPAHDVRLNDGSRLAGICGTGIIQVNSRHHQAVNAPGAGLVVTGSSADGVIEAVEIPGDRFLVGVQWHPEDMVGHFASADALFAAFVAACRA